MKGTNSRQDIYVDKNGNIFVARKGDQESLTGRDYIRDKRGNCANTKVGPEGADLSPTQVSQSDAKADIAAATQAFQEQQQEIMEDAQGFAQAEAEAMEDGE